MKQRNGKCPWLPTRCYVSADAASTHQWKAALSRLCLSGACSNCSLSTHRHASIWLYGDDGLRAVLQGCRGKLVGAGKKHDN
jgi:hypothetical protein